MSEPNNQPLLISSHSFPSLYISMSTNANFISWYLPFLLKSATLTLTNDERGQALSVQIEEPTKGFLGGHHQNQRASNLVICKVGF